MSTLLHGAPQMVAAFLGSSVEAVEATTLVLAAGVVRGWRSALAGTAAGLATLAAIVVLVGPAIGAIPVAPLKIAIGTLLALFGLRWLRKAILRSAGVLALHDEDAVYAEHAYALRGSNPGAKRIDAIAVLTAYKAVVLEGVEVVVIVIGIGAAGGMLVPASIGAIAACALVIAVGGILHKPLARVPENQLKYVVGLIMTAFGLFWFGEGIGIEWPWGDGAIVALIAALTLVSFTVTRLARALSRTLEGAS